MAGFKNHKIGTHPSMNIAFHVDELLVFIGVGKGGSTRQLDAVPFAIDLAKREDMGSVAAVALVKGCSNSWGRAGVGIAARNVNENILQRVAGAGDNVFG